MRDLFNAQLRPDPAHLAAIKRWVAETCALTDDVTLRRGSSLAAS